jgi:hypothetical protein
MNDDPRDKQVEDAYRDASNETPPPELDARILAAARRAVNARPQDAARPPSWLARYRVPLSVAATALIAVSVSLMVDDETRRGPEYDAPAKSQRADPAWGSRSAPAASPPEQRIPSDREAAERVREQRNAVEAPRASETMNAPSAPEAREVKQYAIPSPDRSSAAPDVRSRESAPSANTAASASGDAASPSAARTAPAPAAPPAAPFPAERPAAQVPGADSRERAASDRPSRLTRDEVAAPAGRAAKEETSRTPEAWLDEIRRLRTEGRLTDADAALAAFQRTYPDYALPADLRTSSR